MVAVGIMVCIAGTIHIKCDEKMDLTALLAAMRFNVISSGSVIVCCVFLLCFFIIGDNPTTSDGTYIWSAEEIAAGEATMRSFC